MHPEPNPLHPQSKAESLYLEDLRVRIASLAVRFDVRLSALPDPHLFTGLIPNGLSFQPSPPSLCYKGSPGDFETPGLSSHISPESRTAATADMQYPPTAFGRRWRAKLRAWRLANLRTARATLDRYNELAAILWRNYRAVVRKIRLKGRLNCGKRVLSYQRLFDLRQQAQSLASVRLTQAMQNGTPLLTDLSKPEKCEGLRSQLEVDFENFVFEQKLPGVEAAYSEEVDPGCSVPSLTFDGFRSAHVPDFYFSTTMENPADPAGGDLFEVDVKDYSRIVKALKASTGLPHDIRDRIKGQESDGIAACERFRTYKRARHELLNSILYSTLNALYVKDALAGDPVAPVIHISEDTDFSRRFDTPEALVDFLWSEEDRYQRRMVATLELVFPQERQVIAKALELYRSRVSPRLLRASDILASFRKALNDAADLIGYNDSESALYYRFLCCYWYDYKEKLPKPRRRRIS